MTLPPQNSTVFVVRHLTGEIIEALVMRHVKQREFTWRGSRRGPGTGGGMGRCRLRDEGLTWTRALGGEELDAFRVAVAL